jgi:hypothetical protein
VTAPGSGTAGDYDAWWEDRWPRYDAVADSLRRAGFPIPDPKTSPDATPTGTGHKLGLLPSGGPGHPDSWTLWVTHPNSRGLDGDHFEDLGTRDDLASHRAREFVDSERGMRILREIAAGTHEGNIARDDPLAHDQRPDTELDEPEPEC